MPFHLHTYWHELLLPVLRQDCPPIIPQAVILQEQRVLLVQRRQPRFWELPGGGLLPGEHPEEAVRREVYEETGLHVRLTELLGWYERTGFRAHRAPVYLCQPVSGQPRPGDADVRQVQYFPLQALPRGLCPWYRTILERDLCSARPRPLHQTQRLGLRTVLHCVGLDVGSRLGLLR